MGSTTPGVGGDSSMELRSFLPTSLGLRHSFLNTVWPPWASEFETLVYVNRNNKSRCLRVPGTGLKAVEVLSHLTLTMTLSRRRYPCHLFFSR